MRGVLIALAVTLLVACTVTVTERSSGDVTTFGCVWKTVKAELAPGDQFQDDGGCWWEVISPRGLGNYTEEAHWILHGGRHYWARFTGICGDRG